MIFCQFFHNRIKCQKVHDKLKILSKKQLQKIKVENKKTHNIFLKNYELFKYIINSIYGTLSDNKTLKLYQSTIEKLFYFQYNAANIV